MWTGFFYALIALACIGSLTGCVVSVRNVQAERESLHRRLRSVESQTRLLDSSQTELREIVQGMAESQKMQRVRRATTHATQKAGSQGEPDPVREPELWRAWKNAQLRVPIAGRHDA